VPEQLDQTLPRPAVPDTGRIFGSMARADIRWVIGGLIAAALLLVGFLGPWGPDMVDLEIYRMGGSALLSGSDVYAVRDPATGLAFTYPVFAAVLFIPFAAVPMSLAKLVILALSLAALWTIVHLTVEAVRQSIGAVRGSAFAWSIPLSVIAVIAHPVLQTMLFGQVNLILAAFVLIDVLRRDRSPFRGALVGIAAGIKLVPGIFIVYFLVTGQRRAAVTALLTTLGTVVAGFLASPSASWSYWTNHALDPDRMGGIAYVTNQSILGMSARLLREPHPPPALTFTLSAIVVAAVLLIARQLVRVGDQIMAVSVVAIASLLASPIAWSHHWVWFIPCLGTLVIWAWPNGSWWRWSVVGVATAILMIGPMQFMPKTGLRELHHTLPQEFIANIYGLLAVTYLFWAAYRAQRARQRSAPPSRSGRPNGSDPAGRGRGRVTSPTRP
jgi:alpha-1,2-mannosyltransferase